MEGKGHGGSHFYYRGFYRLSLKEAQVTSAHIPWATIQLHTHKYKKSGKMVKLFACGGE